MAAVVPCKDEADRIAATVAAVASLPQVGRVVVVDERMAQQLWPNDEAVGKRIRMGGVQLGQMPAGTWRYLGPNESF